MIAEQSLLPSAAEMETGPCLGAPSGKEFYDFPQALTFDSAQKAPEAVGDDPCRAALKISTSSFTFLVHR